MKKIVLLLAMLSLTACGTVAGVGQDIKDGANWTRDKIGGK